LNPEPTHYDDLVNMMKKCQCHQTNASGLHVCLTMSDNHITEREWIHSLHHQLRLVILSSHSN